VAYRNRDATAELTLPEGWRVRLEDGLLAGLREWLAPENIRIVYP